MKKMLENREHLNMVNMLIKEHNMLNKENNTLNKEQNMLNKEHNMLSSEEQPSYQEMPGNRRPRPRRESCSGQKEDQGLSIFYCLSLIMLFFIQGPAILDTI